jgi:hypothetical protein
MFSVAAVSETEDGDCKDCVPCGINSVVGLAYTLGHQEYRVGKALYSKIWLHCPLL